MVGRRKRYITSTTFPQSPLLRLVIHLVSSLSVYRTTMKFSGFLAVLALVAASSAFAAPTPASVDTTSIEARQVNSDIAERSVFTPSSRSVSSQPCARDADPSALLNKILSILSEFGSEKDEVLKYIDWIRNVLGSDKKHLFTELEALFDKYNLTEKDFGLTKRTVPADIEGILSQLGAEKQRAIRWIFWLRNTIGYYKHQLINEVESVVEQLASTVGAGDLAKELSNGFNSANSALEHLLMGVEDQLGHILYPNKF